MKIIRWAILALVILFSAMGSRVILAAQFQDPVPSTYIVSPDDLQDWILYREGSSYSFMPGPGTPPLGEGSVQMRINQPSEQSILFKHGWQGIFLSDFTALSYATYQDPSSGGLAYELPALAINIDYDLTDDDYSWQGRLIYEPYLTPGNMPVKGAWQTWNAFNQLWWASDAPGNNICPQTDPCTLSFLISNYPNIGATGAIGYKINYGFENGYICNVDAFVIGINGTTDTYDFEPSSSNTPPVAENDSYTTKEDTQLAVSEPGILINDTDANDDPLTAILVTDVSSGNLALNADGSFIYTPDDDFYGTDTFTYVANDDFAESNIATVNIAVTPANDAPVANDQSVTTDRDTAKAITLTATDVDGDPLTWIIVDTPAHGTLSGTAPNLIYTPDENYYRQVSFTFKVNDGKVDSNVATVRISVTGFYRQFLPGLFK